MRGARNETVMQPADSTQARSLAKYDFPLYMVNASPATHRIMNMKVETVQETEDLCITDDDTIVFMRPKYFGGPSADMWGSESMKMRYNNIGLFEVNPISTGLFCLVVALGGGGVFSTPLP